MIKNKNPPSIFEKGINLAIFNNDMNIVGDWRTEFRDYLDKPNKRVSHRIKDQARNLFY